MSLVHCFVLFSGLTADCGHLEDFSLRGRLLVEFNGVTDLRSCLGLRSLRPFEAGALVEGLHLLGLRRWGIIFEFSVNYEVKLFAFSVLNRVIFGCFLVVFRVLSIAIVTLL